MFLQLRKPGPPIKFPSFRLFVSAAMILDTYDVNSPNLHILTTCRMLPISYTNWPILKQEKKLLHTCLKSKLENYKLGEHTLTYIAINIIVKILNQGKNPDKVHVICSGALTFLTIMAVVEDNFLEFALQETAKGFSQSEKSVNLKPEPVAASKEKMFWGFYQLVMAKVSYFNCSFVSKSICRKTRPVFSYLSSSKLNGRTDSRSKINGFDSKFSSQSFTWRRGCREISIVVLVSLFVCCFHFSGVFSVIFLPSKYTDYPNCRYSLRRDCKRDVKNFRYVHGNASLFRNFR